MEGPGLVLAGDDHVQPCSREYRGNGAGGRGRGDEETKIRSKSVSTWPIRRPLNRADEGSAVPLPT